MNRISLTIVLSFFSSIVSAQLAVAPRVSPVAISIAAYKTTYLKIVYGQPSKKGREIFGKLVPYGEVWRTGANEATEITITRDVIVNGKTLKAGTYALFTIPGKDRWTIIFNNDIGSWGAYNYNMKADELRVEVPAETLTDAAYESFTILIVPKNEKADISLVWDKTKVTLPIQFNEPK